MTSATPPDDDTPRTVGLDDEARRRPALLALVCLLILLESAMLVGLGVAWFVDLVTGGVQSPGATAFLAVFVLGIGALLVAAARGLWQGRRWGRAPVMTWQVLLVVLALGWLSTALAEGASTVVVAVVAVLVVAFVVGVGLLLPPVVSATTGVPAGTKDSRNPTS
ncbi:hypothetical protein [Cellulomonas composti]|uniref:Uncharacterized protein n=1 Tax=Cellulomonas composti TaxID=266130 RepID=A0A511JB39_9CELL|nr:hypothetical protein [Cellulomonas composti]GEL95205.1 hypothetical protein CCO02nite_18630 [Cellulomonas composti]